MTVNKNKIERNGYEMTAVKCSTTEQTTDGRNSEIYYPQSEQVFKNKVT